MAINHGQTKRHLWFWLGGMVLMADAWFHLQSYHDFLAQKQVYSSWQAKERQKKRGQPVYTQAFLIKTWLDAAEHEHCQVIKIQTRVADPKQQHFGLFLHGEYQALLQWLGRIGRELPQLKWEKLSLAINDGLKLELRVDCYVDI